MQFWFDVSNKNRDRSAHVGSDAGRTRLIPAAMIRWHGIRDPEATWTIWERPRVDSRRKELIDAGLVSAAAA